jgi:hypothetical protein
MALEACDTIHVRTRNSDYEIFLLDPKSGRALVRGGEYFAEPVEATVSGSSFGGCMLKMGWIGVGLRMEINVNGSNCWKVRGTFSMSECCRSGLKLKGLWHFQKCPELSNSYLD